MRLRPERLEQHLGREPLLPMYLVSGDELLQVQETCDRLRRHCREQGFDERQVLEVDAHFDWGQLFDAGHSLSLFAERRIVELRLGGAKMDKNAAEALEEFGRNADGNTVLLASCGRLDSKSQRSKWVKVFDQYGAFMQVWPVDRRQLPRWLEQRCKQAGLQPAPEALELLADRVEGNLLAAAQEVEKLRSLAGEQAIISPDMVATAVASSARYDVFKLIDTVLAGDATQSLRMLHGLRGEGAEGIPLLGALCRELRHLYHCAASDNPERAMGELRLWDKRKQLFHTALKRLDAQRLGQLLELAHQTDLVQKGQRPGDGWAMLAELVAAMAGRPLAVDSTQPAW